MTTEQCKTFLQLLDDYLDKTLEPERQAEIERHLEQCARCRHELEAHQRIIASLKQLEKKSAPVTLHTEVLARLQGRAASIPWRSRIQSLFSPRKLRIAMEIAAVFIVVFIGWQIFNSSSLQVTLRDRKATTPGGLRYLGTALETERAAPLSSVPATLEDTVAKVEAEVSKETKEEEAASGITTTEPPEKAELKKEVYETLARPVAPQVEGVDVVPSTAPPDKVAGDQLVIKEEIVGGRTALAPAPSRDEAIMLGEELREAEVQAKAPVQLGFSEVERISTDEENLGAFVYRDDREFVLPKSIPAEEAERLEELRLDFKAKPEAKVVDYSAILSSEAPQVVPELPTGPAIARGEIVAKNGILIQGEMLQPPGSPAPGISIADVDRDMAAFMTEHPEEDRIKGRRERIYVVPATVVISAAPGQPRRVFGYYVNAEDLSQQSKVVERILRQNRGKVLSMKESKDEITIKSLLPASAYRKVVDQLENKGFVIKREVPPKLLDRAREEEIEASKSGHRYYSQFEFLGPGESREPIMKRELAKETPGLGLVEKRPGVQVAPTPVVIFESSISITIIIQGASPSSAPTP